MFFDKTPSLFKRYKLILNLWFLEEFLADGVLALSSGQRVTVLLQRRKGKL